MDNGFEVTELPERYALLLMAAQGNKKALISQGFF